MSTTCATTETELKLRSKAVSYARASIALEGFTLTAANERQRVELGDATPEQLFITAVLPTRRQVPSRVQVFLDKLETSLSEPK
jgi:hypothetical protein